MAMSRSVTTPTRRPRVSAPPTRSTTGTRPTSSSFINWAASDTGVSGDTERGFFDMISEIFIVVLVAEVRGAARSCGSGKRIGQCACRTPPRRIDTTRLDGDHSAVPQPRSLLPDLKGATAKDVLEVARKQNVRFLR